MGFRKEFDDIKKYKEITDGIKDKVSSQAHALAKGAYIGSLEKLKEIVKNGCGTYLMPVGSHNSCGKMKRTLNAMMGEKEEVLFCKDCQDIIKEIDVLLGEQVK